MKYFFLILFTLLINFSIFSQISDGLRKNADAIVNAEHYNIEIFSDSKQIIKCKASITILNESVDNLANLTLFYDKETKINTVKMEFYGVFGKLLKKVKKKDFDDYSATGNNSLYTDDRAIHYDYTPISYPYTVNYEYEITTSNTAFIYPWRPISGYYISIINSSYTITFPKEIKINTLETNFDGYEITKRKTARNIHYSIANIAALKRETLSPSFDKLVPKVQFASTKFQLAGIKGTAYNWQEFGKWMNDELLVTRNNLSEETKTKIKQLVANEPDPIERARIIYDYVQNKTRYISVQISLGGWMPMLTDDVDKLAYGDCKALTYYTKSLLDIANVPSYYTIVYAGSNKRNIQKDLVSVQGNHAFLCLPTAKDTIWLECTSQKVPFGYVNDFTDDRDVLVITENGGIIKHTNTNMPKENLQHIKATYSINDDGKITGKAAITSLGTQYDSHLRNFDGLSTSDLEKKLKAFYPLNNIVFENIKAFNNKPKKQFEESFDFSATDYAKNYTSSTLVFQLNPLNRNSYIPKRVLDRKTPFEIRRGYNDIDEYTISLPASYQIDTLPENTVFKSKFGTYITTFKKENNTLIYTRNFTLNKGLYPKEDYTEYRDFKKKINKLDNIKLMLNKQ